MNRLVEHEGAKAPLQKDTKLAMVNIYGAPIDRSYKDTLNKVFKVKTNTKDTIAAFNKAGAVYILSISETPGQDNPEAVSKFIRSVGDHKKLITVIPTDGTIYSKRFLVVRPVEVTVNESTKFDRIRSAAKQIYDTMI